MKLELEAEPYELLEKGEEMVRKLAHRLGVDLVHLADTDDLIRKAQGKPNSVELRHKALKESHARERTIFSSQMKAMLQEIDEYLEVK